MRIHRGWGAVVLALYLLQAAVLPGLHVAEHQDENPCAACERETTAGFSAACSSDAPCGDSSHHHHHHSHIATLCRTCAQLAQPLTIQESAAQTTAPDASMAGDNPTAAVTPFDSLTTSAPRAPPVAG